MQQTRQQIVEIIKHQGQATVDELARALGITLMAVRLHLVVLERDSLVTRSSLRMGPGRPTLIYRLTDEAEEVFPKAYDALASELLNGLRRAGGSQAVEAACMEAAAGLAHATGGQISGVSTAERVKSYVAMVAAKGYPVELEPAESGFFVNNYSCPFYRVARTHREVCVLHRNMLRQLLGADVETVTCHLDGDLRCSHLVRVPAPVEATSEPATEYVPESIR